MALACAVVQCSKTNRLACLYFESLISAKSKGKINLYLSFRNFGTPKYPESRNYAKQALYFIFTGLVTGSRIFAAQIPG